MIAHNHQLKMQISGTYSLCHRTLLVLVHQILSSKKRKEKGVNMLLQNEKTEERMIM